MDMKYQGSHACLWMLRGKLIRPMTGTMKGHVFCAFFLKKKIVSEYDQEIPQSQTVDKPKAPRGRATQQLQDTMRTNQAKQPALSSLSR